MCIYIAILHLKCYLVGDFYHLREGCKSEYCFSPQIEKNWTGLYMCVCAGYHWTYRPGASSIYLCERGKKVWPFQCKPIWLVYMNILCWHLDSCAFDPETLFVGSKKWLYLCECRDRYFPYGNEGWGCRIINSAMPATLDWTPGGPVTL